MARERAERFWCDVCGKSLDGISAIVLRCRLSGVYADWAHVPKELIFCEKCIHIVREGFESLFPHQQSGTEAEPISQDMDEYYYPV